MASTEEHGSSPNVSQFVKGTHNLNRRVLVRLHSLYIQTQNGKESKGTESTEFLPDERKETAKQTKKSSASSMLPFCVE